MKNKILYIILTLFIFTSCGKDYLDKSPTSDVPKEKLPGIIKENPDVAKGILRGMYALMCKGQIAQDAQVDFSIKAFEISTDMVSGDMAQTGDAYNKFWDSELLTAVKTTSSQTYRTWTVLYKIILIANNIIKSSGGEEKATEGSEYSWGQGKAMRAYMYYKLAVIYGKGWAHKGDKLLPVYLSDQTEDGARPPMSIEQLLTQCKKDAEQAVKALKGYKQETKANIDINIARGILSYICLYMEDYEGAKNNSQLVIDALGGNLMSASEVYNSGWRDITINGFMWGSEINKENTTQIGSYFAMLDIFTYGYASTPDRKRIDRSLFAKIHKDDIRRFQFLDAPGKSVDCIPYYKFWHKARVVDGDKDWEGDYEYMRVAEMYLINAEAKAFLREDTEAKKVLEHLIAKRHAKDVTSSVTNKPVTKSTEVPTYDMSDIKKAVNLQWRIECWGEGKAYGVLKRFKYPSERGSNHAHRPNEKIPYDSDDITFQIPQREVLNNPHIN